MNKLNLNTVFDYSFGCSLLAGAFIINEYGLHYAWAPLAVVLLASIAVHSVNRAKLTIALYKAEMKEREEKAALEPKTYSCKVKCLNCRNYWYIYVPEGTPFMTEISSLLDQELNCEYCKCLMTADAIGIADIEGNWALYRNVPTPEKREKLEAEMVEFRKRLDKGPTPFEVGAAKAREIFKTQEQKPTRTVVPPGWPCSCGQWNDDRMSHCISCKFGLRPSTTTAFSPPAWQCTCSKWNEEGMSHCISCNRSHRIGCTKVRKWTPESTIWNCSQCHEWNRSIEDKCDNCGSKRKDSSEFADSAGVYLDKLWHCSCETPNHPLDIRCSACHNRRKPDAKPTSRRLRRQQYEMWQCTSNTCKRWNGLNSERCDCGKTRTYESVVKCVIREATAPTTGGPYMVLVHHAILGTHNSCPKKEHPNFESARTEAMRLSKKENVRVTILKVAERIEPFSVVMGQDPDNYETKCECCGFVGKLDD